jgi:hypothetical protein
MTMFPADGDSRDFTKSHHEKHAPPDIDIDKINNYVLSHIKGGFHV